MGKTLQELIDEAKTIVSTERSDLNQAKTLSRIHNRLFVRLGKDSSQYSVHEDVTVADQLVYDLPTNCRINNIVNMKIQVETYEDSGVYEDYEYKSLDESIDFNNCFIRGDDNDEYKLYENGSIITVDDRAIIINHYKNNISFDGTNLTIVPSLDDEFHDYLIYMLVAENLACGDDPDKDLANYWKQEANEYFEEIQYKLNADEYTASTHSTSAKEYM